jgi:hypothetical protein
VVFKAGPEGLRVRAHKYDLAVEYHQPGALPVDEILVPGDFLDDSEGGKDETVTLENGSNGHVIAQWRDKNIPQLLQYDIPVTKDIPGSLACRRTTPARTVLLYELVIQPSDLPLPARVAYRPLLSLWRKQRKDASHAPWPLCLRLSRPKSCAPV